MDKQTVINLYSGILLILVLALTERHKLLEHKAAAMSRKGLCWVEKAKSQGHGVYGPICRTVCKAKPE